MTCGYLNSYRELIKLRPSVKTKKECTVTLELKVYRVTLATTKRYTTVTIKSGYNDRGYFRKAIEMTYMITWLMDCCWLNIAFH